ncbi:MAG: autotransporter outer membrane beta-barrel domain-containing protein [Gammaproteobacteria bacterium]|nr:autotransporter outer membrane beta-barrel domain-containing protein [Gammaproteobacteria bacterium]
MNNNRLVIFIGSLITGSIITSPASATRTNEKFEDYMAKICVYSAEPITDPELFVFCDKAFPGSIYDGSASFSSATNPSSAAGLSSSIGGNQKEEVEKHLEQREKDATGSWGLLLAASNGEADRAETEFENAYGAKDSALILGLDYSPTSSFIIGFALGNSENDIKFTEIIGSSKSDNDSKTIYATWTPINELSFDIYKGRVSSSIDSTKYATFGSNIEGEITSSSTSEEDIAGLSINWDKTIAQFILGVFIAKDISETDIDPYSENGDTDLELSYGHQKYDSDLTSAGVKLGYIIGFDNVSLIPSVRFSKVQENKNDSQTIDAHLILLPDEAPFTLTTDAPDRDFYHSEFSLVLAFNNNSQLFFQYEKKSEHLYLEESAVNAGAVIAF